MLDQTGLRDRAGDPVGTLSGGNRQRVNVAVGLLAGPDVLLLDEPSAALDPRQRARLWEFVGGLARAGTTVVYATHDIAEAERHADRVLVLADGELLFWGTPRGARGGHGRPRRRRLRGGLRRLPARAGASDRAELRCAGCCSRTCASCAARRSCSALLVAYPVLVALLVGVGLSSGPVQAARRLREPRPAGRGHDRAWAAAGSTPPSYAARLFEAVEPVRVRTRAEAIAKVRSGEVLGALVIPADAIDRLQSTLTLGGGAPRRRSRCTTPRRTRSSAATCSRRSAPRWQTRTARCRRRCCARRSRYLDLVVAGGTLDLPLAGDGGHPRPAPGADDHRGGHGRPAGRRAGARRARSGRALRPPGRGQPRPLPAHPGARSARRCACASAPSSGSGTALDVFGAEVAVTLSLMVVALLLAAGMLALEREEHAFGRLVRGLVSRTGLLVEKVGLAALCALGAGRGDARRARALPRPRLVARAGLAASRSPSPRRPSARSGVAIGALAARCAPPRCSPSCSPCPWPRWRSSPPAPWAPALRRRPRRVGACSPSSRRSPPWTPRWAAAAALAVPLLHLAALALGFTALARVALRRFG